VSWFWLILITTNLFSVSDLIDKFFCTKKFKNTYAFAASTCILSAIFIIGLSFLVDFSQVSGWPLFLALASGPLYYLMWLLLWRGMAAAEVSRVIAVYSTMPIFNAFLATIFLHEQLTSAKWLAIILIAIGAALCSWENKGRVRFNAVYFLVLLSALIAALANVISKLATEYIDALAIYSLSFVGSLPFYLAPLLKKEVLREVKTNLAKKQVLGVLLVRTLITFIAVCFYYLAIDRGPISLVMAINGTGPLFVFLYATLASIFLPQYIKEELKSEVLFQKAVAVILVVAGVILINR
jgi:uncharacterized membrane protein